MDQILQSKDTEWLNGLKKKKKKTDSTICCLQQKQFSFKDTQRLKMKNEGMEKIFHANGNQKEVGVAVSNKTYIKTKTVIRNKECHYMTI